MNVSLPIVGSPSRAETALACERRHVLGDIVCRQPVQRDEGSMSVGTVVHAGAAAWWRTGDLSKVEQSIAEAYAKLGEMPFTCEWLQELGRQYAAQAKLCAVHSTGQIVAVEERVIVDLGPAAKLSFKIDRLTRDPWVLVDTKTKGKWGPAFERKWEAKWRRSVQQMLYQWAVRHEYGVRPAHFIEAVVKELPTRVYYVPLPEWTDAQLEEVVREFVALCQRDAALVASAMLPGGEVDVDRLLYLAATATRFNFDNCEAFNRPCQYLPLCLANPAERLGLLLAEYEHVEPEYLE